MNAAMPALAAPTTSQDVLAERARAVREDGFCVLRGLLPRPLIDACREAFAPLHAQWAARTPNPNRGPARMYLELPFAAPFSDPLLYEHPEVLALVEATLGLDPLLLHYGTDTPSLGSQAQGAHSDLEPLFPETWIYTPAHVISVNIPFVDIDHDNGPMEIARGTHLLPQDEAYRRLATGEVTLEPVLVERGDVIVRDPRTIHQGTPNRTAMPRPMAVLAYMRPWMRHEGFEPLAISPVLRGLLSERARRLLRLHLHPPRSV
jgi:hypothetical protein